MGRINYGYADRYLLTLTARADGSSRLAPGNKWHYYPAAAVAWNAHNEEFLKDLNVFSNLKLRLGIGQTSNTAIAPYQTLGGLSQVPYSWGSVGVYGEYPSSLENKDLGWEFTLNYNAGLDIGLFKDRIVASVDWYLEKTKDILLPFRLPQTSGVNSILSNIGSTENRGIEITLSPKVISNPNGFNWSFDLNFYINKSKITSLLSGQTRDLANLWFVGQPINVIYDYNKIGIWQQKDSAMAQRYGQKVGQIRVQDVNGDSLINASDKQILGTFEPKWQGGITNRFSYKGFDFSFVIFAHVGGKLVSTVYQPISYLNMLQGRRNGIKVDFWTPTNPTNDNPEPDASYDRPLYGSTLGYFDATYVKIRSINLGYTLPDNITKKVGISSLHLYVTVTNPFKAFFCPYVKYGGVDPEPTGRGGSDISAVPDRVLTIQANTPPARSFIFGMNLKF